MTQITVNTIKGAYRNRLFISYFLILGCISLVIFYGYSIFSIMNNSIEISKGESSLGEIKREIANLSNEVSKIESEISIKTAYEKGFKGSEVSMFILKNNDIEISKSLSYSAYSDVSTEQ